MAHTFASGAYGALTLLALSGSALAQPLSPGDGSHADNAALFAGASGSYLVLDPGHRLAYPAEPAASTFDIDLSLTLRGTYETGTAGEQARAIAAPQISVSRQTLRGTIAADAGADLVLTDTDAVTLERLLAGLSATHALDRDTTLTGSAAALYTEANPTDPTAPSGAPAVAELSVSGAVARQMGAVNLTLRGSATRTTFGPTESAGVTTDNSGRNETSLGTGLRIGLAVAPRLDVFADAEATQRLYDDGVRDGDSYELRGGLATRLAPQLAAEASLGLGLRRFADDALPEITATLYDASITFTPDPTLSLRASLATEIAAPDLNDTAAAVVTYRATADAAYQINSWLGLRASAFWSATEPVVDDQSYGAGLGADYLVNSATTVSADYTFDRALRPGVAAADRHQVSLGVTLRR